MIRSLRPSSFHEEKMRKFEGRKALYTVDTLNVLELKFVESARYSADNL